MSYFPENVWVELFTIVDGLPTWTNIGGDIVSPIKVNCGFSDGDPLSRLAPGSDMRFDLNNIASGYNPSSTFYKGQKIRLRIKYGSLVKTKFFGYIDHIGLDAGTWGARLAHVVCVDWLALAAKTPARALPSLTNTTIDLAVRSLLTQMQMQPERLDIEVGNVTLPSVFDQITTNSTIYSELQNLVAGEWSYIYMRDGGETLKVENSTSRNGDGSDYKTTSYYLNDGVGTDFLLEDGTNFLLEDNTNFLLEGEPTAGSFDSNLDKEYTDIKINHGDELINTINATAVPVVIGASTLVLYPFDIATGSKAFLIPLNSTYVFQGQYKDPTAGGAQISGSSIVTPVVTTDWRFNSKADGTGTDLSGNVTIAFTAGQSGFKAIIANSGAPGYITKFNVRGIPVYRYSPVETTISDQRSVWDYGDYSLQFTRQYGASTDDVRPYIFRLLMRNRKPRTIFSNPKFMAIDTQKHLAGFLALDIGDQIRLTSTKPASDAVYYIQGVKFTILPGSEQITFDYITTESLAGDVYGVNECAVELTERNQYINFGYLPYLSNHVQRSITARVNRTSSPAGEWAIFSIGQFRWSGYSAVINRQYFTTSRATTNGIWRADSAMGVSTWYNLAITYDSSNDANEPVIYIDGVSSAVTVLASPVGTITLEDGQPVQVGGVVGSEIGFPGQLQNVAYYNRILTPAEITTIHNGGTRLPFASYPKEGLRFFFGGIDSDIYAAKLNAALDSLDTLYDMLSGFPGQPMNAPTLRAVG